MNTRTKRWLISYAVTAVIFAVLDLVWIGFVASNLYQSQIGHLIAPRPNDTHASLRQRVTGAALFGFFTYATWALTAFAVLKDFTAVVAVTDILWGAAACSLVTWLTATVLRRFLAKDPAS